MLIILKKMGKIDSHISLDPIVKPKEIFSARIVIDQIHISEIIQK